MINLFFGANKAGRSHILLSVAKALSNMYKVLVVDMTASQGVFNYLEIDKFEENFDIYTREFDIAKNFRKANLNSEKYDYILVEADKDIDKVLLKKSKKIFLVQNYDKDIFNKNLEILYENNKFIDEDKFNIIFNQLLPESKLNIDVMYGDLISRLENKFKATKNDYILIPYSIEDLIFSCNNKFRGKFNFSEYSNAFKDGLYEIVNKIDPQIDEKRFKGLSLK